MCPISNMRYFNARPVCLSQTVSRRLDRSLYIESKIRVDNLFQTDSGYGTTMPDLLVTVNFTALNISSDSVLDTPKKSAQLMIGLTNDTDMVMRVTCPTILIPGVNLFGTVDFFIWQTVTSSVLAAFGLFDVRTHTISLF